MIDGSSIHLARCARLGAVLITLLAILAGPAFAAETPEANVVPTPRPDIAAPETPATGEKAAEPAPAEPAQADQAKEANAEPPAAHRAACPAVLSGAVIAKQAPPLRDGACGNDAPLLLESAAGVAFTGDPQVTCEMVGQLAIVAERASRSARELLSSELQAIVTGPGYECRRRNRAAEGKLSEHAFANALDIASFKLADGRQITIEGGWPAKSDETDTLISEQRGSKEKIAALIADLEKRATTPEQKFLAAVHAEACRNFTTVLSPDANAAHASHLHFDLGCHGRTCTYVICE